MLLLSGPPGSGKTSRLLERVREPARRGAADVRLLTPTATMAEHLQHRLAREGLLVRPRAIGTLFQFVDEHAPGFRMASAATLRHLIGRALRDDPPAVFLPVREYAGFRRALAGLIEELGEAGLASHRMEALVRDRVLVSPYAAAVAEIYARVEMRLMERGEVLRAGRLRSAAASLREQGLPGVREVLLDGFFTFSRAEIDLIVALAGCTDVTVTLPRWAGSEHCREELLAAGFVEQVLSQVRPKPVEAVVAAPNQEAEVTELVRRILLEHQAGRAFRDIGVALREYLPYGPALRTAFERFGIPARFYFGEPLARQPAVRRLIRLVDAVLGGTDLEKIAESLRMAPAAAKLDGLDFEIRAVIPARGVAALRALPSAPEFGRWWDYLEALEKWPGEAVPAVRWAQRLADLRGFFREPWFTDHVAHERAGRWRLYGAALEAWVGVLKETAAVFDAGRPVGLAEFWNEAREALEAASIHLRDHRHNVVHVMDVYEARQWELPVFFLCGLLEGDFPRRHFGNPLLPDPARQDLRRTGYFLPTAGDAEAEEEFLFSLALSRATAKLVLSFPEHNRQGEESLPSFFLQHRLRASPASGRAALPPAIPMPGRNASAPRPMRVAPDDLRTWLTEHFARLSPSRIEAYLECPFLFFAREVLALAEPPPAPSDRLDSKTQGQLVHAVLAAAVDGRLLETAFAEEFTGACEKVRAPAGYRTERLRLEMLTSLRGWMEQPHLPPAREIRAELEVNADLGPDLAVRGRLDLLHIYDGGRALVIDYKYSSASRLKEYVEDSEAGRRVQAGLYLEAVRQLGYTPAGMVFFALRNSVKMGGWHTGIAGMPDGIAAALPEVLAAIRETAIGRSHEAAEAIRRGAFAAAEEGGPSCRHCVFADICRREGAAEVPAAAEGGAA